MYKSLNNSTVLQSNKSNPFLNFKASRAILPIIIGLTVVIVLLYKEFDIKAFQEFNFTKTTYLWLFVAVLLMLSRDFGYMIRLKILSDNYYTWYQAFKIIMLWEFTSSVTPSAIGGTGFAVIYVHKEGLSVGKSTALVMATSFLDELYFVIMFPLLLILINPINLFVIDGESVASKFPFLNEFFYFAIIGYTLKLIWVLLVSYGLFINPKGLKWLIFRVFKLPVLKRWIRNAVTTGNDIISSSKELKKKSFVFWLKAFGATFISWTARYWVVNALFLAFFVVKGHFLIFARQLVMMIMMIVSPTPGGSGFAEFIFKEYLNEFIIVDPALSAAVVIAMALLWRLVSYYPYLFIGAIILPRWITSKFKLKNLKKKSSPETSLE